MEDENVLERMLENMEPFVPNTPVIHPKIVESFPSYLDLEVENTSVDQDPQKISPKVAKKKYKKIRKVFHKRP